GPPCCQGDEAPVARHGGRLQPETGVAAPRGRGGANLRETGEGTRADGKGQRGGRVHGGHPTSRASPGAARSRTHRGSRGGLPGSHRGTRGRRRTVGGPGPGRRASRAGRLNRPRSTPLSGAAHPVLGTRRATLPRPGTRTGDDSPLPRSTARPAAGGPDLRSGRPDRGSRTRRPGPGAGRRGGRIADPSRGPSAWVTV